MNQKEQKHEALGTEIRALKKFRILKNGEVTITLMIAPQTVKMEPQKNQEDSSTSGEMLEDKENNMEERLHILNLMVNLMNIMISELLVNQLFVSPWQGTLMPWTVEMWKMRSSMKIR